jgi:ketosteroid isomerase-like protein
MNRNAWWGFALVACAAAGIGAAAAPSGPDALVDAEHGFAADVAQSGIRFGFLAHLAPAAVVFAPGPVNAVRFYQGRPATSPARLSWEPSVAVVTAEGDLGWTSGPWQWRSDSLQAQPEATGTFVTLWRRQADGTWRVVLDTGVSHESHNDRPDLEARTVPAIPGVRRVLGQRNSLWRADADFATNASHDGLASAIDAAGAPGMRLLGEGAHTVVGRGAARDSAAARHPAGRMMSLAQYVSDGGELGYTYGTFVEGAAAAPDSSYYLHIWERAGGHPWQLVLELFSPVPKKRT